MFHDKEQSLGCFYDLIDLNNAWMSNDFQNVDFSGDPFNIIDILNLPLVQNLNSDLLTSVDVVPLFDFSERSLSQSLLYLIISDNFGFIIDFWFGHNDFSIVELA